MATLTQEYTYEDYALLPEGKKCQLIHGEIIMSPAPSFFHQSLAYNLVLLFANFIENRNLGVLRFAPVDVLLSNREVYQPDIIFISKERLDIIDEQKVNGAPDLVVEILSPATAYYDLTQKRYVYEKNGVKEYWIVDPAELTVEVLENVNGGFQTFSRVRGGAGIIESKLLSGLFIDSAKNFSR